MMKFKSMQYSGSRNILRRRFHAVADIDYWLSNKDRINDYLTDIKPPKKRHFRSIAKSKSYQFGGAYKFLKNRYYMRKTRHRIYNTIEVVWTYFMLRGGRR